MHRHKRILLHSSIGQLADPLRLTTYVVILPMYFGIHEITVCHCFSGLGNKLHLIVLSFFRIASFWHTSGLCWIRFQVAFLLFSVLSQPNDLLLWTVNLQTSSNATRSSRESKCLISPQDSYFANLKNLAAWEEYQTRSAASTFRLIGHYMIHSTVLLHVSINVALKWLITYAFFAWS